MVWVAVPFAAGVSAGAFLAIRCGLSSGLSGLLAPLCLLPVAILLLWLSQEKTGTPVDDRVAVSLSAAFCGMFCYLGWHCRGDAGLDGPVTRMAARCVAALRAHIDSIPYSGGQSAALVKALLSGDRSGLSRESVAAFRSSGASHLLALSGLHLGFIYLMIKRLSAALPWHGPRADAARAGAVTGLCGFYTLMTGAGPSIVRAFLFILINEISSICPGRKREPGRTLLSALTIQLAISPGVITTVGFQLSYLAMTGIIWIFPHMEAWYPESRSPIRRLWVMASLSISCQATTAPLAWLYFHSFPKYFLITNLIAMPLTSAVMAISIAVLIFSALGVCPHWLILLDDRTLGLLLHVLHIISSM